MNDMSKIAAHNVVATYRDPGGARAALTMLERKGVEGTDIELFGPGMDAAQLPMTNDEMGRTDLDAAGALAKRFSAVSFVVAVAVAGVGALLGYLLSDGTTGLAMGGIGGFIVGGLLGFLYGGYSSLPANEQWEDTYAGTGETSLAVHSDNAATIDAALQALKGTGATRVATCGPDRQLRDVA